MRLAILLSIGLTIAALPVIPRLASATESAAADDRRAGSAVLEAQAESGQEVRSARGQDAAQEDDGDEPDVLLLSLLTVGAAAAAAVVALIGYVIRNRVGFWLHRPPPRDRSEPQERH